MTKDRKLNEIDTIVDKIIGDSDKAEKLKDALHKGIDPDPKQAPEVDDDADDLWENLPV